MKLKNHVKIREQKNWSGAEAIARKLYEQGQPLTAIHRYLTQKADLNYEQSLTIIKRLES